MKVSLFATAASTTTLLLSLSCLVTTTDASEASPWWANETKATYVNWPSEVLSIVEGEATTFHEDNFPGLPVLRVFQTFPEYEPRIWPMMKGMTRRLHPIMWPRLQYYMESGVQFGCRTLHKNGTQVPVLSAHCHRHCIHQGRYCAAQKFEIDINGPQGHDALKEILHRLCLDQVYHAKDKRVMHYMEEFEKQNCWAQEHIRNCSMTAMETAGTKWSEIVTCVAEEAWDLDVPNEVLENNLQHILNPHNFTIGDMPQVLIDGSMVPPGPNNVLDINGIWHAYCQSFPEHFERPFACDVCEGCQDVRTCLWTLTCDGEAFDMQVFLDDGQASSAPPATTGAPADTTTTEAPRDTDAPRKTPNPATTNAPMETTDTTESEATSTLDSENDSVEGDSDGGGGGHFLLGMFIVVAVVACPLACYFYRERRTKQLMAEIRAGKYTSEFRNTKAYKDRNMELGGRQKELDDSEPYVDVVMDDDIKVEDMTMDDESEFNENKRSPTRELPDIA